MDASEYQPLLITTSMAKRVPAAVHTLSGTNLKGLGFKSEYEKVADGVWFPVRHGGEFEVKAIFYKWSICIGLRNSDFRRAEVTTKVHYQLPAP